MLNRGVELTGALAPFGYLVLNICLSFVQLGFNLSNEVTDTLETSSVLIYLIRLAGIYSWKDTLIKTRV